MMSIFRHIATLLFALATFHLMGQNPKAAIDRSEMRIGEQAIIELSFDFNGSAQGIRFPEIGEKLVGGIEVVSKSPIDTVAENSRLSQKLYITGFDSGYYAIPPFVFEINGEKQQTEAFLLTIKTVELDSLVAPRPEQGIYEVEVTLLDYIKAYQIYIYGAIGILTALALILFLLSRRKKSPAVGLPELEPEAEQPAHLSALLALEELKKEKLHLGGRLKEFHTKLTDILREYLEKRFGVQAQELTSRQIISQLTYLGIAEIDMNKLRSILFMADMVKFAKALPEAIENEQTLENAIQFVQHTANTDLIAEKQKDD